MDQIVFDANTLRDAEALVDRYLGATSMDAEDERDHHPLLGLPAQFLRTARMAGQDPSSAVQGQRDAVLGLSLPVHLQACVLLAAHEIEQLLGRRQAAQHLTQRLSDLRPMIQRPDVLAHVWGAAVNLAGQDEDAMAGIACCQAAQQEFPKDSQWALDFALGEVNFRIKDFDLLRARQDLDRIETVPLVGRNRELAMKLAFTRNLWDLRAFQPERVLATQDTSSHFGSYHRFRALLIAEDWRQAEVLAARLSANGELPPAYARFAEYPQALLAVAHQRWSEVDAICSVATARAGNDLLAARLLVLGALARRRGPAARLLLDRLDPEQRSGEYLMEWVRCFLIAGDLARARAAFDRLRLRIPREVLSTLLDRSPELRPSRIAQLCLWDAQPVPPPSPPPAAERWALVGAHAIMADLRRQIGVVASSDLPVLIHGETGTGKENAARQIHAMSARATAPFIAINAASLADSLAEAELFGHAKGAFTGAVSDRPGLIAQAGNGVIFLDEVNSLPMRLQGMLLRLLEEGEYRAVGGVTICRSACRFLFASNEDLASAASAGRFRADLLFRIDRISLRMPSLREHIEDIPELCRHLLRRIPGGEALVIDQGLLADFAQRPWPGNIRELRNVLERRLVFGAEMPAVPRQQKTQAAHLAALPPRPPQPRLSIPGSPDARERRTRIMALFGSLAEVYPADAAKAAEAAPSTVNRDLQALVQAGLITRIIRSGNQRSNPYVMATASI